MKQVDFRSAIIFFVLFFFSTNIYAQVKWDGGAGTSEWSDANNWVGNIVPVSTDSVVLDNSLVSSSYTVNLPGGTVNTSVARIRITPTPPNTIALLLPVTNTSTSGALTLGDGTGDPYDFRLDSLATFLYRSGATSGTPFVFTNSTDSMWLGNGATWNHNTKVGQSGIANKLSKKAGTELGLFIYDIPGASSSIQFQNTTYGSVTLRGDAYAPTGTGLWDTKRYITTGSSACNIRGNFTIDANARDSSVMTNSLIIKGNCTINGYVSNAGLANPQFFVFSGTSEQTLSGRDTTNFINGLTVSSGSTLTLNCNLYLRAVPLATTPHNQTLTVSGTLNSGTHTINGIGNVVVNAGGTFSSGSPDGISASGATGNVLVTGTRTFPTTANYTYAGTTAQNTGDGLPSTVNKLTVNNSSGITLTNPCNVSSTLTLTSGLLNIGNNDLTLASATTIAGTPSASNMVVATGSGLLKKILSGSVPHSFTFPIGDNTGTAEYSPVNYTLNSGTFSADTISVKVSNTKHPSNTNTNDYLKRYWTLSSAGVTSPNYSATFTYVPADVVGTESGIIGGFWNGSAWTNLSLVNTGSHTFTASSRTLFGDFSGLAGAGYVTVKVIPQGYYNNGGYLNATDTISVYLANGNSPFGIVDTSKVLLDSISFTASAAFNTAATGSYFLVVKQRTCVETWSATAVAFVKGATTSYDFTDAQSKAYGSNQTQVSASPVRWAIFSGDVNQDGYVDPLDMSLIDQDSFNYVTGLRLSTDINGDGFVDPLDMSFTDQNSFNYVGIKKP